MKNPNSSICRAKLENKCAVWEEDTQKAAATSTQINDYSKLNCGLLVWLMSTPPAIVVIVVAGIYLFMVEEVESLHFDGLTCKIVGGGCFVIAGNF